MLEMNKITRKKNQDYTVLSNVFLKDRNLSIKAKGLLAVVMGLPEDWEFSINGLCSILKEGKTAIYNVIDELKGYGYCNVVMCRDELGRISGSDYTFFEEPQIELPQTDKPYTENPDMDNTPQLNTYSIKDTTNKVKESKDSSLQKKFNFKQALLDLGVCENVVKDFILVRKNKHATDSETAFKRLQTEIIKSGLSANDCITIAVENDWKGFRVEWIQKQNGKYSIEGFSSYSTKNVSGRAGVYMNTLTVPVQIEKNGIKYLSDGTYVENGKRYYTHRIRGKIEVSMGAVARPNEDWEWNSSTLTWEQDERTITISDMLF